MMVRKGGREFKKYLKHLRSSMAPNISISVWAEALKVGLHSKVEEDSPHGRMIEGSAAKGSKKPDEFKEAITDLAKIMTDHVMQKGHKTPPLRNSPMKQVDTSPNVSMPLKAAEVKSIYIQQVKDLHGLDEVGATYQSGRF